MKSVQGAQLFLSRRAAMDLRAIHSRSIREWGAEVADRYLADLYTAMKAAAVDPERGRLRQSRSVPFLMVSARQHFVIYELMPQGIVVLTIWHQGRDIERLIAELTPNFLAEVERLKQKT